MFSLEARNVDNWNMKGLSQFHVLVSVLTGKDG